jgi:hypothetical protein
MMLNAVLKRFLRNPKGLLLILLGSIAWSLTIVKSGLFYSFLGDNGPGLGFWGANGHDGIWHLALSESLGKGSWQMPIFAGYNLQNYHIGFDLILGILQNITTITPGAIYFQILPPITAFFIGVLTYKFVIIWSGSKPAAYWSLFFVYFGGSFSWILGKGESAFWSQQAISTLINPPFSLSLILILWGLIQFKKERYIFASVIWGLLTIVKVYAGILTIGALFALVLWGALVKKEYKYIRLFLITSFLSLLLFLTFTRGSQSLITITPFWYLETLMSFSDRLDWQKYYSAMTTYRQSKNYLKLVPAYAVSFVIFLVGNFGSRILMLTKKPKFTAISVFMYSFVIGGILIPMIFLQKGTPWNTIQFFYYSLFFASILAGSAAAKIIKGLLPSFVLILITLPTTYITLSTVYIPSRPPAMLPRLELEALQYLKSLEEGIVLTKPFNLAESKKAENDPPRPLRLYASTAYVSAYSAKTVFLEDEINLDITGYPWQNRLSQIEAWYQEKDNLKKRQFLVDNNIKYIYWVKEGQSPLDLTTVGVENIFENELVTLYRLK